MAVDYQAIVDAIDEAILANQGAGGPIEVQIDDRELKYDSLEKIIAGRKYFASLINNSNRGSAYRVTPMTFGSTR